MRRTTARARARGASWQTAPRGHMFGQKTRRRKGAKLQARRATSLPRHAANHIHARRADDGKDVDDADVHLSMRQVIAMMLTRLKRKSARAEVQETCQTDHARATVRARGPRGIFCKGSAPWAHDRSIASAPRAAPHERRAVSRKRAARAARLRDAAAARCTGALPGRNGRPRRPTKYTGSLKSPRHDPMGAMALWGRGAATRLSWS